jgi:hypothetical protein
MIHINRDKEANKSPWEKKEEGGKRRAERAGGRKKIREEI